jgi:hypothetical protein
VVTVFSGFYPSLILSGFKPVLALRIKISSAAVGGISLRRSLVVLQFAISQMLIIGTIVAISQMNFIAMKTLASKRSRTGTFNQYDSAVVSRQKAFKEELLTQKGIQSVSFSSDMLHPIITGQPISL